MKKYSIYNTMSHFKGDLKVNKKFCMKHYCKREWICLLKTWRNFILSWSHKKIMRKKYILKPNTFIFFATQVEFMIWKKKKEYKYFKLLLRKEQQYLLPFFTVIQIYSTFKIITIQINKQPVLPHIFIQIYLQSLAKWHFFFHEYF